MESLNERFDAVQENLLEHYETGSDKIEDQIMYWQLIRQEYVLLHYARKKNIMRLGLQTVPTLAVSEHKAKQAIMMTLQLTSLKNSAYGTEPWTMQDTSYELFNSAPQNTFKKGAFTVDVIYDNDEDNYYPYTAWSNIYYQNGDNNWHKVEGKVDYEGLYYETVDGEKIYYVTFDTDAIRYSRTHTWTVKYKNNAISSTSITSTSGRTSTGHSSPAQSSNTVVRQTQEERRTNQHTSPQRRTRPRASSSERDQGTEEPRKRLRRRGGRGEGKQSTRRDPGRATRSDYISPAEVGRGHRLAQTKGLNRLGQLQEEARDPPLVLLKGPANTIKCWRFRCKQKYHGMYSMLSTGFSWVGDGSKRLGQQRMLIAFTDYTQRQRFLNTVIFPKGTSYSLGYLDSL
uniref:Regulatory protein E2 n=1 Tax=Human papillomavirus TaxID=10566 RepID=A0A385PNQ4_9PAPI|nr:MAG: E2 protein [Human papillomavirus]